MKRIFYVIDPLYGSILFSGTLEECNDYLDKHSNYSFVIEEALKTMSL